MQRLDVLDDRLLQALSIGSPSAPRVQRTPDWGGGVGGGGSVQGSIQGSLHAMVGDDDELVQDEEGEGYEEEEDEEGEGEPGARQEGDEERKEETDDEDQVCMWGVIYIFIVRFRILSGILSGILL